ncbi:hypothetical protein AArcSl_1305 [Halalkaliarchaeum desulfuricum]|uniref:Uncharacterized protein n=1 Tax=Halalkaliarchaeum desulfuricum TaxID=2055893 RepID=A0A343TIL4_9EURY|nr:hypothetical protein [Halalkaliarchaeum desulfuricum]AUX08936.1 hypothetical protein AArcSl_1305 [Halalkaliarchaeum desulfuricum]
MNLAKSFQKVETTEYLEDGQQIRYELDEEEIEHAKQWAKRRHNSYASGETRDEDWGDSLASMERGVAVELVLALIYEECEFDTYVGADGDDGSDGQLEIDGSIEKFDVKSSTANQREVPFDVELLVARHHVDERDVPPVLVSAYVAEDLSEVRIRGWIRTLDFLEEADVKDAYAGDHQNYALSVDELEPMPKPTGEFDEDEKEPKVIWYD